MIEQLKTLFGSNEFMSGAIGVSILAYIWVWAKGIPAFIKNLYNRFCTTRLEINQTSDDYKFILQYVRDHCIKPVRLRKFTLNSLSGGNKAPSILPEDILEGDSNFGVNSNSKKEFSKIPTGTQFFIYKRRLVKFYREFRKSEYGIFTDEASFIFYTRKQAIVDEFLLECSKLNIDQGFVTISTYKKHYDRMEIKKRRNLNTVILNNNIKEEIISDFENFLKSFNRYEKLGVPYKRNYLFQGPPGTGKSSFILGLATKFKLKIYNLQLSSLENFLTRLDSDVFEHRLIVFEDIDKQLTDFKEDLDAIKKDTLEFKKLKFDSNVSVSESMFINFLDGLITPSGSIIILTTNNPEHLQSVITRPGRIDRIFDFNFLDEAAAKQLCDVFNVSPNEVLKAFKFPVQPAALQERLMQKIII